MQAEHVPQPQPRSVSLWAGVWGAPLLWGLQFEINYAFVPWICGHEHHRILYVTTIVALVLGIVSFIICASEWQRIAHETLSDAPPIGRRKFFAGLGMLTSALFTMLIFAQGIPSFFIKPCWD